MPSGPLSRGERLLYDAVVHSLLANLLDGHPLLIAVAAPVEIRGVFSGLGRPDTPVPGLWEVAEVSEQVHVLHSGVSKVNAAGAVASVLVNRHPYGALLSIGIAGSLPGGPPVLGAVTATGCVFGDEGIVTSRGYETLAQMGFPMDPSLGEREHFPTDPTMQQVFRSVTDAAGLIAAVSICSGTDELARAVFERTGALAEAMEGAPMALVARRRGVRFCEVRTISNLTGDRAAQQWDIKGAIGRLSDIVASAIGPVVR